MTDVILDEGNLDLSGNNLINVNRINGHSVSKFLLQGENIEMESHNITEVNRINGVKISDLGDSSTTINRKDILDKSYYQNLKTYNNQITSDDQWVTIYESPVPQTLLGASVRMQGKGGFDKYELQWGDQTTTTVPLTDDSVRKYAANDQTFTLPPIKGLTRVRFHTDALDDKIFSYHALVRAKETKVVKERKVFTSNGNNNIYSTGSSQEWTVPWGLKGDTLNVTLAGGSGGCQDGCDWDKGNGFPGGKIDAEIRVSPGDKLFIYVGRQGGHGTLSHGWGAHNGASGNEQEDASGGGSTELRIHTDEDSSAVLSAGGGAGSVGAYGGGHNGEGGSAGINLRKSKSSGTGLVIKDSRVKNYQITRGGGAGSGENGKTRYWQPADGNITFEYMVEMPK